MKKKLLSFIIIITLFIITGCQNDSEGINGNYEEETQTSESKKIEAAEFSIGTRSIIYSNNIVSVPAVLENSTDIEQQFSSRKLFLSIDQEVYSIYQMGDRAADFKLTIPAGERWFNTFSFEVDTFTDDEIKEAKLIYASDDESLSYSKPLTKDYIPSNHSKFFLSKNSTTLSTYYSKIDDAYEKRTDLSDTVESLKKRNEDNRYFDVQTLVMITPGISERPSMMAIYVYNPTKTDIQVPLNAVRLHSAKGQDYDIASDAIYDTFLVPAGKWQLAMVPLETVIEQNKGPYVVQFKEVGVSFEEFSNLPERVVPTFLYGMLDQDFFTVPIGNVAGVNQGEELEISLVDEGVIVKITNNSLFTIIADPLFFTLHDKNDPTKIVGAKFMDEILNVSSDQTVEYLVPFDDYEMIRHIPELVLAYDNRTIAEIK